MNIQETLIKLNVFSADSSKNMANALHQLEQYVQELLLFNSVYDLVGTQDKNEIITYHIFDSLNAFEPLSIKMTEIQHRCHKKDISIADIGSGAGLPGIPLAIFFPQYHFTLVERMSKRCAFLENCVAVLGLQNVSVKNGQIEDIPSASFDLAVFRAFRPLNKSMIQTLFKTLTVNGWLAAYKAKKEKIIEEMNAIAQFVTEYQIVPLNTDFLAINQEKYERNVVFIRHHPVVDLY